jgi:hypothetical protein
MPNSYQVPIVRTRIKKKHITSMHLISGFMFVLIGAVTLAIPSSIKANLVDVLNIISGAYIGLGILIVSITIIFNKALANKNKNFLLRLIEIIGFGIIATVCILYLWWMPFVYALIGIITVSITYYLELNAHQPEYIHITENGIYLKRLNKKHIEWSEVKNLLIRHGNITINLKNNTLYQYNAYNFKDIQNKEAIELFAQTQIDSNAHKYIAEW